MRPSVDLADPLAGQVRVQLCRGDAGMPEQLLHHAQVGPAFEQVRCETMPQRVRSHMAGQSGPRRRSAGRTARPPSGPGAGHAARRTVALRAVARRSCRRLPAELRAGRRRCSALERLEAMSPTGTTRSRSPLPMTRTARLRRARVLQVEAERLAHPQPGRRTAAPGGAVADADRARPRRAPRGAPRPRPRRASRAALAARAAGPAATATSRSMSSSREAEAVEGRMAAALRRWLDGRSDARRPGERGEMGGRRLRRRVAQRSMPGACAANARRSVS